MVGKSKKSILWFKEISKKDVALVGGKNASLGEMFSQLTKKGINIPDGFALTSYSFWYFLKENGIDKELVNIFQKFNPNSLQSLKKTGKSARQAVLKGRFPQSLEKEIVESYKKLSKKYGKENTDVAVRSSATAEDLKTASFAGQMETYLNIRGKKELLKAVKKSIASLFTDRAISYREEKGFSHLKIALSVGVQKMVRSDLASSGVIFTLDTETGFQNVVLINSVFGIGEMIVKGKIIPDEFYVFKPTLKKGYKSIIVKNAGRKRKKLIYNKAGGLKEVAVSQKDQLRISITDQEILTLAKWAVLIEDHYKFPQDIEWAKDGKSNKLFIVQSRPETVHAPKNVKTYQEYEIKTKKTPILTGIPIGYKIGQGRTRVISDVSKMDQFKKGEVLVTKMTDPDWVPIMRMASAIITDEGGKTAHAAIVSRELGVPAIVGTREATKVLKTNQQVTVDCTQGRVFLGKISFRVNRYDLGKVPKLPVSIVLNLGIPEIAFKSSFLPVDGVGLARQEFIIAKKIRIHPLALYHYKRIKDKKVKAEIDRLTEGFEDKKKYFIDELAEGISQIAAAFYPKDVIVRLSDFKTNEYAALIGGKLFEPKEKNPMLGWRGASRYYDKEFKPAFEMETQAIKKARDVFGLKNIWAMVPFCRTIKEGKKVLSLMEKNGLKRVKNDLKIIVMCEIPSNIILAKEFLNIFDGMSIGSNDLTQLVLGIDRDSAKMSYIGDERNEAVKEMISEVIKECRKRKKYIGICGEAPSYFPDFAYFLLKEKIDAISLNPDSVIKTILALDKKRLGKI
ncbi:MAG: phosphoenolpyruvate synthase [Patescibacteria group bacterium]|nr:phosphoenolpyruvate synthase [Patescibacteria group bacterium]